MGSASRELFGAALRDLTPAGRRSLVFCMAMYLKSIDAGTPTFFLPKEIADSLGNAKLTEIANSYAKMIGGDVALVFDKTFNVYRVAPAEFMVGKWDLTYIDTVHDKPTFQIPRRKWERIVDLELGCKTEPVISQDTEEMDTALNSHIKRPSNSYILFRRAHRRTVQERYPAATLLQVCTITAEMWAHADKFERLPYIKQAQRLKDQHRRRHARRNFSPRLSKGIDHELHRAGENTS